MLPIKLSLILLGCVFHIITLPLFALTENQLITQSNQCPQDISELANLMINDISDYGNRILQKSRRSLSKPDFCKILLP